MKNRARACFQITSAQVQRSSTMMTLNMTSMLMLVLCLLLVQSDLCLSFVPWTKSAASASIVRLENSASDFPNNISDNQERRLVVGSKLGSLQDQVDAVRDICSPLIGKKIESFEILNREHLAGIHFSDKTRLSMYWYCLDDEKEVHFLLKDYDRSSLPDDLEESCLCKGKQHPPASNYGALCGVYVERGMDAFADEEIWTTVWLHFGGNAWVEVLEFGDRTISIERPDGPFETGIWKCDFNEN